MLRGDFASRLMRGRQAHGLNDEMNNGMKNCHRLFNKNSQLASFESRSERISLPAAPFYRQHKNFEAFFVSFHFGRCLTSLGEERGEENEISIDFSFLVLDSLLLLESFKAINFTFNGGRGKGADKQKRRADERETYGPRENLSMETKWNENPRWREEEFTA